MKSWDVRVICFLVICQIARRMVKYDLTFYSSVIWKKRVQENKMIKKKSHDSKEVELLLDLENSGQ